MDGSLDLVTVVDGARPATEVAAGIAALIDSARRTLDAAVYDFHPGQAGGAVIARALEAAAARGVAVRVAFNLDHIGAPVAEHPDQARPQAGDGDAIEGLSVPTRAIAGQGCLMHHKYVVVDRERVMTGSVNWTDDALSREENVMLTIASPALADAYAANFADLWEGRRVEGTGGGGMPVRAGGVRVTPYFSPHGDSLAHVVAAHVGEARRRLRVLSPVMTSGPVLGTIAEPAGRHGFDVAGAFDWTQMREVGAQWHDVPANRWKIAAWEGIAARLSGKRSTPYRPGAVHDYMHAKVIVADQVALVGSYNLSRGGLENAENLVVVEDGGLADRLAAFTEKVAARYRDRAVVPSAPE